MPCGCTDNRKLNENKLNLDDMKDMSIDEIVNLYRQGYILESPKTESLNGDILSLASYPNITDVAAFYDDWAGRVTIMVLWNNSGSSGYANILALDGTFHSLLDSSKECVDPRTTPFNYLTFLVWQGQVNIVDVYTKSCASGENCTTWPYTCTTENTVSSNLSNGVPMIDVSEPTAPVGTITPLNGALRITWTPSTGADIFVYEVIIFLQGNYFLLPIYTQPNIRDITIDGLTNGVTYDIWITAKSRYNIDSWPNWQGSGIPTIPTPVLTTIAISPSSQSINVSATTQLNATCKDQNNTTMTCPTLTWSSSSSAIASVNSSGLVTGVSAGGPVNITASASGKTSNASAITVTSTGPVLTTIAISPSSQSINVSATTQLNATCKDQNNTTMTCPTLTWSSSSSAIASVNSSGLVTGVSAGGPVNITASASGKTSNASAITVTSAPVLTNIIISPTTPSIGIGGIAVLNAICKDQNNNNMTCPTLTWISSNTAIATVIPSTIPNNPAGIVTGVSPGSANITASVGVITSNISAVTVTGIVSILTNIEISPTSASIAISGTRQLTATCKDQDNALMTCPTLTWESSDITKATVNSAGLVTGVVTGSANIVARYGLINSNISAITITATPPAAGGGGGIAIAAAAALVLAYLMLKPKTPIQ